MRRVHTWVAAALVPCGVFACVAWLMRPYADMDPERQRLEDELQLLAHSIPATGSEPDQRVATQIRQSILGQRISPAAQRAYYQSHPEVFGTRPFEDCAPAIRRVLAIEAVQDDLGLERTP